MLLGGEMETSGTWVLSLADITAPLPL